MSEIFSSKISFFVPSTGEFGRDITDLEFTRRSAEIADHFTSLFGGSTIVNATGNGKDTTGKIVNEKIKIVYSFMSVKSLLDHYDSIIRLAKRSADKWYQETVVLEGFTDGKYFAQLVTAKQKKSGVMTVTNGWHSTEPITK